MVVLVLVHDDLDVRVLEDAQTAGVVGVEMTHHDVPEIVRTEPELTEAVLEAHLR